MNASERPPADTLRSEHLTHISTNTRTYQSFRDMNEHPDTIDADDLDLLLRVAFLPQEGLYNPDTVDLARTVVIRHAVRKGINGEVIAIDEWVHRTDTPNYVEIERRITDIVARERDDPFFQNVV